MRVIVDTNALISGIFFAGLPGRILQLWNEGRIKLVGSTEIYQEYAKVMRRLGDRYPDVEIENLLQMLAVELEIVKTRQLKDPVCRDRDDDKFIACALPAKVEVVISGDKDLLDLKAYRKVRFLSPARFLGEIRKI